MHESRNVRARFRSREGRRFIPLTAAALSLAFLSVALGISSAAQKTSTSNSRPNIILLLADDMGYRDPSCFGGKAVRTPNLDALAAQGVRLTRFYAASAVCTPSRAAILTGRYPLRFDIRRHFPDDESHLPRDAVTLPELLKKAGYVTGHVGKWHLGGLHLAHILDRAHSIPGPQQHGFDHYLSQIEEQPLRGEMARERMLYRYGGHCLIRDEKYLGPADPYYDMNLTDIIATETIRLIQEFHRLGQPFYLNVCWSVPHTPYYQVPEPYWTRTAAPGISKDQHRFRSMVAHMDARIGDILATLDRLGIRENTFIFFTSDNGGAWEADIGPFKGGKTDLHEGGIRVPAIASWPGRIPAGVVSDGFGQHVDLLPTFCEAAGVELPASLPLDGLSLLAQLTRGAPPPKRGTVFWQMDLYRRLQRHYPKPKPYATEIARRGRWKLLARDGRPVELIDLEADPLEDRSLLGEHPEIARQLAAELRKFLTAPRDRSGFATVRR